MPTDPSSYPAPTDWESSNLYQKSVAPWEDSPGAGSRDIMTQNAYGWGAENLGGLFQRDNGDLSGIFDPSKVSSYLASGTPATAGVSGEGGWEGTPASGYGRFTDFSIPQLQSYLDWQRQQVMQAGNPGNDAMWLPEFKDVNGNPMVSYGKRAESKP